MTYVLLLHLVLTGKEYPISLGYIAASLIKNNINAVIKEINLNDHDGYCRIAEIVKKKCPNIIGFSAYQSNIKYILILAKLIKKINSKIIIIIGGPQVTFMPKVALREMPYVDILCRGEGEIILPALCNCINSKKSITAVAGIVFRRGEAIIETRQKKLTKNLDDFSSPYKSGVFDFLKYKVGIMLSSRGCSFDCNFCYTPNAFHHIVRYHSLQRILEDMDICIKNRVTDFFFADPSFTYNKKRTLDLMQSIIEKRWKVSMWCETRTDLVNKKILLKMAKAGVKRIAYGLETVDKNVMSVINKKIDLENFKKIIKITRFLGIKAEVFTMYGLPGQTYKSACKTIDFLNSLGVKMVGNSSGQQFSLYFGTNIYNEINKFGINIIKRKRPSFLSPGREFNTVCMGRREISLMKLWQIGNNLTSDRLNRSKLSICSNN